MKKILLYTFIAAASALATSCNDYLDCEPITSVSTNVYLYSETDLAAYAAKFYNVFITIEQPKLIRNIRV